MATAQLTTSSICISTRSLASFEGQRPSSTVKFASVIGGLSQRSFRGLVVKAATTVAPKLWRKISKQVTVETSLIAENWKIILTGLAF